MKMTAKKQMFRGKYNHVHKYNYNCLECTKKCTEGNINE